MGWATEGLLFFSLVILGVSGGFITDASSKIPEISGYENISELKTAHTNSIWAAVICWLSVAIILGLLLFYFAYTPAKMGTLNKIVTFILFIIILIPVFIVGVLSAVTADYIKKADLPENNSSYRNSIIAAVLAIIGFVLLLIGLVVSLIYKAKEIKKLIKKGKYSEILPDDATKLINRFSPYIAPYIAPYIGQNGVPAIGQNGVPDIGQNDQNFVSNSQNFKPRFPNNEGILPRWFGKDSQNDQYNQWLRKDPQILPDNFSEGPQLGGNYRNMSDTQINDWIKERYNVNVPKWLIKAGNKIVDNHIKNYYPEIL